MKNPTRIGLAVGIVWAVVLAITTLLNVWTGYGAALVELFTSLYPGYAASYLGALLALIYGAVDGFIGGYLIAWVYEKLPK